MRSNTLTRVSNNPGAVHITHSKQRPAPNHAADQVEALGVLVGFPDHRRFRRLSGLSDSIRNPPSIFVVLTRLTIAPSVSRLNRR